jgi:hypothetical protein
MLTKQNSVSLGAGRYRELLTASGLSLVDAFSDEGANNYYSCAKL